MQHISPRPASVATILALFALLASACGNIVTASDQRAAVIEIGPTTVPILIDAAPAVEPDSRNGVQFGATLDEWTEAEEQQQTEAAESADTPAPRPSEYAEIAWDDLIPAGASTTELIAQFDDRLKAIEPGSEEANALYEEIQAAFDPTAVDRNLDGEKIRLAGFVAPLTYDDDIVTEFLLVPTFGACIHVPPPPANQTVMVSVDRDNGLTVDDTWGAVWVEGTIEIEAGTTDLGSTSYRITNATSGPYTDF